MADNYLGKPIRTVSGAQSCLGEGTQIRKEEKEISVSASLATTEGCGRCPVRSGRRENDNIPYIINTGQMII